MLENGYEKVGYSLTFSYRCLNSPDRTVLCRVDLGQKPSPRTNSTVAAGCTET